MNENLQKLYQSIILKHNKEPFGFVANPDATHVIEAYNPICGDRFSLYIHVEKNIISDLSFHGYGCAISKAATSVLVEQLLGKEIGEGLRVCKRYLSIIGKEKSDIPEAVDENLLAFSAAQHFPGRLKCASLAWDEMTTFLTKMTNP